MGRNNIKVMQIEGYAPPPEAAGSCVDELARSDADSFRLTRRTAPSVPASYVLSDALAAPLEKIGPRRPGDKASVEAQKNRLWALVKGADCGPSAQLEALDLAKNAARVSVRGAASAWLFASDPYADERFLAEAVATLQSKDASEGRRRRAVETLGTVHQYCPLRRCEVDMALEEILEGTKNDLARCLVVEYFILADGNVSWIDQLPTNLPTTFATQFMRTLTSMLMYQESIIQWTHEFNAHEKTIEFIYQMGQSNRSLADDARYFLTCIANHASLARGWRAKAEQCLRSKDMPGA